jgi:ubiquinone/menaquinone biosynthesis C-methylase UbiE
MAFSGYPNGRQAMAELFRVLKKGGKLLIVDFSYPSNGNRLGYWFIKLMESVGDTIRDIPKIIHEFSSEHTETEVGVFGSVHLYLAKKPTNGCGGSH